MLTGAAAHAGPLRELLDRRRAATPASDGPLPAARVLRDVPYGDDPLQRFDVYLPQRPAGPVILMVHGGGWRYGDKASRDVVENKARHWLAQGVVFVSANNRLLPTDPLEQAKDVARALAAAQRKAESWGADAHKFILMGHSAGAHLASLVAASPALANEAGVMPWRGTVSLDSGAVDTVQIMQRRHPRLYDEAFGSDPAYWRTVSPVHVLSQPGAPFLAVCSTRRRDSCAAARHFADKAVPMGMHATVLEQPLSHREINAQLGAPGAYTDSVDRWINSIL